MRGYEGLSIDTSTAFLRPVQIMRRKSQYVRHSQTSIAPYHRYKGLSSLPQKAREYKTITNIPIDITNPIYLIWAYKGLADIRFGIKGLINKFKWFFYFSYINPVRV